MPYTTQTQKIAWEKHMKKHYESRKVLEGWGHGIRKGSRGGEGVGEG